MKNKIKWKKVSLALLISVGLYSCLSGHSDSYVRDRVVKIVRGRGSCSGEQVRAPSGVDYILTAGHCLGLAKDGAMTIIMENGNTLSRRVIAEDDKSDLLLLEGLPNLKGLEIADRSHNFQPVTSFTHRRGMATEKTQGYIVQSMYVEVPIFDIMGDEDAAKCTSQPKYKLGGGMFGAACVLSVEETVVSAQASPGSSGGPMVDSSGDLIGVVSAGSDTHTLLVMLSDIKAFLKGY